MSNTIKAALINNQTLAELHYKKACKFATAGEDLTSDYTEDHDALTITKDTNGVVTIDGGTLALDDHILVKDQTDTKENGIYKVTQLGSGSAPLILTREDHFNSSTECASGKVYFTIVSSGLANAHKSFFIGVGTEAASTAFGQTTFSVSASGPASKITVADESSDTTCFPVFTTGATGDLTPKSGTNLTFNSNTGELTATKFSGELNMNNAGAGTLDLDRGGTGSTTASGTRSNLGLGTMATENVAALTNSIVPNTTNSIDLGSSSKTFRDLYLSGSSAVIGDITLSTSSSSVLFTNTSSGHPVHNSNVLYHKYFHPSSTDSVALTTSFKIVPTDGELHGTFTTPANVTSVIVEAGAYLIQTNNNRHIYFGLSGHSNRSTYQEFGTSHSLSSHITTEKFISYGYYNRRQKSVAKWFLKNLTGSTSYTINLAAKASSTGCYANSGGSSPPIWIKVTVPESNEDIEAQNISTGYG